MSDNKPAGCHFCCLRKPNDCPVASRGHAAYLPLLPWRLPDAPPSPALRQGEGKAPSLGEAVVTVSCVPWAVTPPGQAERRGTKEEDGDAASATSFGVTPARPTPATNLRCQPPLAARGWSYSRFPSRVPAAPRGLFSRSRPCPRGLGAAAASRPVPGPARFPRAGRAQAREGCRAVPLL